MFNSSFPQIDAIEFRFSCPNSPLVFAHERNSWNALKRVPAWCADLMRAVEQAGAWQTGIESDKKKRGSAINADLYGYDAEQGLAVVQVREAVFRPGRYTRVRKDYYLIGTTESGATFAHPIESPARSKKSLATPESCVRYVLARIWNCRESDLEDIERQGDVAFVPITKLPEGAVSVEGPVTIRDTHELRGEVWRHGDTYYTRRGARLVHTKRQHAPIKARAGLYRVQPGIRAETWGFTAPHGD